MKRPKYFLSINTPCNQNWAAMENVEAGKYCQNCAKNVIDFTKLTDREVVQIIEQSKGKLCGRFKAEQLDRDYSIAIPPRPKPWLYKLLAGLFFLGTATKGSALGFKPIQNKVAIYVHNIPSQFIQTSASDSIPPLSSNNLVKGKIIDVDTKESLTNVAVQIKGTTLGNVTDDQGNFSLAIPDEFLSRQLVLSISYLGYDTIELAVENKRFPFSFSKAITMTPSENGLTGEVCIVKKRWRPFKKN
ncbi:carboxypeptidase-like regulatory domain-containing protein [Haliscomenobacter hydrossis]|uniref:TonB-dependent receptor plug n=1 Tax=Haliscomenobacter hydrossis (strain ATCC 27775 / DSM 1100 / LMG 10767 / O) TaxID=760192 RepID=F4KTS0_HALH1|nr:carboxypeptidase-like regulatory domain-containing protein [Haliscomenobacter hydrossis]AEE48064.1 hypothetical protein Halhy_0151 [Haliscomenobacter hydrossis DSM 1100]